MKGLTDQQQLFCREYLVRPLCHPCRDPRWLLQDERRPHQQQDHGTARDQGFDCFELDLEIKSKHILNGTRDA